MYGWFLTCDIQHPSNSPSYRTQASPTPTRPFLCWLLNVLLLLLLLVLQFASSSSDGFLGSKDLLMILFFLTRGITSLLPLHPSGPPANTYLPPLHPIGPSHLHLTWIQRDLLPGIFSASLLGTLLTQEIAPRAKSIPGHSFIPGTIDFLHSSQLEGCLHSMTQSLMPQGRNLPNIFVNPASVTPASKQRGCGVHPTWRSIQIHRQHYLEVMYCVPKASLPRREQHISLVLS